MTRGSCGNAREPRPRPQPKTDETDETDETTCGGRANQGPPQGDQPSTTRADVRAHRAKDRRLARHSRASHDRKRSDRESQEPYPNDDRFCEHCGIVEVKCVCDQQDPRTPSSSPSPEFW